MLVVSAQTQTSYTGTNITGQLVLARTVNPAQLGASRTLSVRSPQGKSNDQVLDNPTPDPGAPDLFEEMPRALRRLHPPLDAPLTPDSLKAALTSAKFALSTAPTLPIAAAPGGFNGLTHADQRNASSGNQFSTEPPNPSIAVANGYVLLGVNNAIQVYSLAGTPLLPRVLSSNELFGVSPAIDRTTGVNGVYPTDMRVFHDQSINRWFVLQRAQDYEDRKSVV